MKERLKKLIDFLLVVKSDSTEEADRLLKTAYDFTKRGTERDIRYASRYTISAQRERQRAEDMDMVIRRLCDILENKEEIK